MATQHPGKRERAGSRQQQPAPPRWATALGLVAAIAFPPALYYVLRRLGMPIYPALVVVAVATGLPALRSLLRRRPGTSVITTFFSLASLAGVLLAFIPGSPQFLMARDAVITAATGTWFIFSLRSARPLVYTFSRPLLEGRLRWPGAWESLWESAPRFRRMWKLTTLVWGIGFFIDAALRVHFAYTLPADAVPAATTAMYLITNAILIVLSNIFYVASGVFNPSSKLFAP